MSTSKSRAIEAKDLERVAALKKDLSAVAKDMPQVRQGPLVLMSEEELRVALVLEIHARRSVERNMRHYRKRMLKAETFLALISEKVKTRYFQRAADRNG